MDIRLRRALGWALCAVVVASAAGGEEPALTYRDALKLDAAAIAKRLFGEYAARMTAKYLPPQSDDKRGLTSVALMGDGEPGGVGLCRLDVFHVAYNVVDAARPHAVEIKGETVFAAAGEPPGPDGSGGTRPTAQECTHLYWPRYFRAESESAAREGLSLLHAAIRRAADAPSTFAAACDKADKDCTDPRSIVAALETTKIDEMRECYPGPFPDTPRGTACTVVALRDDFVRSRNVWVRIEQAADGKLSALVTTAPIGGHGQVIETVN
jgi:hypothetical protein